MKGGAGSRLPSALVVPLPPRAGARRVVAEAAEAPEPNWNWHLQNTDLVRLIANSRTIPPATTTVASYRFSGPESSESSADEGF